MWANWEWKWSDLSLCRPPLRIIAPKQAVIYLWEKEFRDNFCGIQEKRGGKKNEYCPPTSGNLERGRNRVLVLDIKLCEKSNFCLFCATLSFPRPRWTFGCSATHFPLPRPAEVDSCTSNHKKDPAVDSHWRQFSAVNYIVCFKKKKKYSLSHVGIGTYRRCW